MKFLSILSVAALVSCAILPNSEPQSNEQGGLVKRADAFQTFRLKLKSKHQKALKKKYLSRRSGVVGVFGDGEKIDGLEVTMDTQHGWHRDNIGLSTYPIGIVQHALGVTGHSGYLDLLDLTLPSGHGAKHGDYTYCWQNFTTGELGGKKAYKETRQLFLGPPNSADPGWIAAPIGKGEWVIKHYNRSHNAVVIQNYIPVEIYLERGVLRPVE
ncbi:hypothetical protein QQZ08_012361 [Neonectria magnoliae]|uniref:Uncharacterized protein n=1 Tax=Neonectria magnoliae TaxID=2732573 RepID=A0ABR1H2T2_9HYPO